MEQKRFNGERLKSARMYRALTLTELGKRARISKQSLSLYENNNIVPEHMKVQQLANELNFPYEFFFQEEGQFTKIENTYFRSLASTSKKSRNAQAVKLEYVAKLYEVLLGYIEFPDLNIPQIDFEGYDDVFESDSIAAIREIEGIAKEVREYWGLGNKPIKDFQLILEENGIIVTGFDTEETKIDAFSQRVIVEEYPVFLIAVALGTRPEGRIRFDMAHELGHILMHPWTEDLEAISKEEFKMRERQANMFASAFLLPRESFGQDISVYPTNLEYYQFMKKKWKVSIQAMMYRTHQLNIISDNQYQYMMRQVSKKGWRLKEPEDIPFFINESIFQGAIDLLVEGNYFSAKEIMDIFKKEGISLYPEEIEKILGLKPNTLLVKEEATPIIKLRDFKEKNK